MLTEQEYKRADWILAKCQLCQTLTEWETDFVDDLTDRLERYGRYMNLSEKQWVVLERLAEKASD